MKPQDLPGGLVHEGKAAVGILGRNRRDEKCRVGVGFCLGIAIAVLVWRNTQSTLTLNSPSSSVSLVSAGNTEVCYYVG